MSSSFELEEVPSADSTLPVHPPPARRLSSQRRSVRFSLPGESSSVMDDLAAAQQPVETEAVPAPYPTRAASHAFPQIAAGGSFNSYMGPPSPSRFSQGEWNATALNGSGSSQQMSGPSQPQQQQQQDTAKLSTASSSTQDKPLANLQRVASALRQQEDRPHSSVPSPRQRYAFASDTSEGDESEGSVSGPRGSRLQDADSSGRNLLDVWGSGSSFTKSGATGGDESLSGSGFRRPADMITQPQSSAAAHDLPVSGVAESAKSDWALLL